MDTPIRTPVRRNPDLGVLSATSTTIQSGALALRVGRFGPDLKNRTLMITFATSESDPLPPRVPRCSIGRTEPTSDPRP